MPDLSVHMNVTLDGLEVNIGIEGDRSLARGEVMVAAQRAAARAARAMHAALNEPATVESLASAIPDRRD